MKNKKVIVRLLSFFMTLIVAGSTLFQQAAFANIRPLITPIEKEEISEVKITGVSLPVAGCKLSSAAIVTTSESVTWEIPVIWVDESGKAATMAEAGHKYLPTFVFYVPTGFKLKGLSSDGSFEVALPDQFLTSFGRDALVFIKDSSKNLIYITWNASKVKGLETIYPAASVSAQSGSDSSGSSPDVKASDDKVSDNNTDNTDNTNNTNNTGDDENEIKYREVYVHCAKNTIMNIGEESLAFLVDLIKNTIEPRAIQALVNGFPAFADAVSNGELGGEIGLYVYDMRFEMENDRNVKEAVAYVAAGYENDGIYKYLVGINSAGLFVKDAATGTYVFDTNKRTELENTLVHELMHACMDDYNRTGMASSDYSEDGKYNATVDYNHFPKWVIEGSATTVENAYVYEGSYYDDMKAVGADTAYTSESVIKYFSNPKNSINYYKTNYNDDVAGAYVGGYLAWLYLSSLVAGGVEEVPTSAYIRDGMNTILEKMHNGTSLDEVIRSTGEYTGLKDFEARFLTSQDTGSVNFTVNYLNYLDKISNDNGLRANGSILLDFDTMDGSALERMTDTSAEQGALVIKDTQNKIASTVSIETADATAGSYHVWQDSDNDSTTADVAARTTAAIAEDGESANPATSEETSDITATAAETAINPVAETETIPDSDATIIPATEEASDITVTADTETIPAADAAIIPAADADAAIIPATEEASDIPAAADTEIIPGADADAAIIPATVEASDIPAAAGTETIPAADTATVESPAATDDTTADAADNDASGNDTEESAEASDDTSEES